MRPTEAELWVKFDALQKDYQTKLDGIFANLYKQIGDITPDAPISTPEAPRGAEVPKPTPTTPEAPKGAEVPKFAPTAPSGSPEVSTAPVWNPTSQKWQKPPRWRDTWTYQGLKGLASRVWRGTNPEQDIAWKYKGEGLQSRLTLQEYLVLKEAADDFVDHYFVIEEGYKEELIGYIASAAKEIKRIAFDFLKQAQAIGLKIGEYPPKQRDLFNKWSAPDSTETPAKSNQPDQKVAPEKEVVPTDQKVAPEKEVTPTDQKVAPEKEVVPTDVPPNQSLNKGKKEKKAEVPIIENPTEKHKEILEDMMDQMRWEDLQPFEPWTWFAWTKKPSGIYKKFPNPQEALLKQWQDQAGKKLSTEAEGLTNLFVALDKGWFGDIDYTNNSAVTTKLSNLIGKEVKGRPWTDFVAQFKNDEDSAMVFINKQGVDKPSRGFDTSITPEDELDLSDPTAAPSSATAYDFDDDDGSYSN